MLGTRTTRTTRTCHWMRRLKSGEKKNKDQPSDAEEEPDLSHEEWQKVNGRFKTAMNKNQTASNLSRGNVQKAKRQAMLALLMDPSFGKGFQQYTQTVSYDQRHTTTERPETFRQLLERYEEGEIDAMVDAWEKFSTCFLYLHGFKLNRCSMLRNQGKWWNCQHQNQECKTTSTRACGRRAGA